MLTPHEFHQGLSLPTLLSSSDLVKTRRASPLGSGPARLFDHSVGELRDALREDGQAWWRIVKQSFEITNPLSSSRSEICFLLELERRPQTNGCSSHPSQKLNG